MEDVKSRRAASGTGDATFDLQRRAGALARDEEALITSYARAVAATAAERRCNEEKRSNRRDDGPFERHRLAGGWKV